MDISIHHLTTLDEYNAAVALQYETWGPEFAGCVPASILMVSQKVGGITAGAFTPEGRMVGCVFGITGIRDGEPAHWSDILAVTPDYRGTGLGKRLKWFQRMELLKAGVRTMYWTYDPLQALNANLNINTLRARPVEYIVNMYGDTGSVLHAGIGTDRFIVQWDLGTPEVANAAAGKGLPLSDAPDGPIVNTREEHGELLPDEPDMPEGPRVLIEVPLSINESKQHSRDAGARWRNSTRAAFQHYLGRGWVVTGFHKLGDRRRVYALEPKENA